MNGYVRCAGFYGDAPTEPACGWAGPRSMLRDGRTCPVCGAGHIVSVEEPQPRVAMWVISTFGSEVASNVLERALRCAEEAIELAQACGVSAMSLHRLVDYVFSRPSGNPAQEVAGTLVTTYALASALGVDAAAELEREMERIHQPETIERCRRRQIEKREAALTGERS